MSERYRCDCVSSFSSASHGGVEAEIEIGIAAMVGRGVQVRLLLADALPQFVEIGECHPSRRLARRETVEDLADVEDVSQHLVVEVGHLRSGARRVHRQSVDDELLDRLTHRTAGDLESRGQAGHRQRRPRSEIPGEDRVPQLPQYGLGQEGAVGTGRAR